MRADDYQRATARTDYHPSLSPAGLRTMHVLGIAGEAGEIVDLHKKALYHQHSLPTSTVMDELGDLLWYIARLAADHNLTLSEIMQQNLLKLQARYPNGFDPRCSQQRQEPAESPAADPSPPEEPDEIALWQQAIYDLLVKNLESRGIDPSVIDGAASDGDELAFTLAEIEQAITAVDDFYYERREARNG
jgi:NTP pyrophosphatase (non-canonical NTP hydrolase)